MKATRLDEIDLSEWTLDTTEAIPELKKFVLKAAGEVLEIATKERIDVDFPVGWDFGDDPSDGRDGKPPEDPMEMRVKLPIGGQEFEEPEWSFNLREIVEQLIDSHKGGLSGKIDSSSRGVIRIRDGLRELADMIDAALVADKI